MNFDFCHQGKNKIFFRFVDVGPGLEMYTPENEERVCPD